MPGIDPGLRREDENGTPRLVSAEMYAEGLLGLR
jgi:hypothetical protein